MTLADAISQLVLERGMRLDDVLELTPKTIWYLFEQSATLNARSRLQLVSDMTAAAAPSQFVEGGKVLDEHVKSLVHLGDLG